MSLLKAVVMSFSKNHAKLFALTITVFGMLALFISLPDYTVSADGDKTLEEIAGYRTWTKLTKAPVKGASLASLTSPVTIESIAGSVGQFNLDAGDIGG